MIRRLAPLACLLAAACSGSSGGIALGGDAAPTSDAGAPAPEVPTSCMLATQSPCAVAEQCNPYCQDQQLVIGCRPEPSMPAAVGAPCSAPMPCGRGSTCLAVTGKAAACMKLCAGPADCPSPTTCRAVHVTYNCNPAGAQTVTVLACL